MSLPAPVGPRRARRRPSLLAPSVMVRGEAALRARKQHQRKARGRAVLAVSFGVPALVAGVWWAVAPGRGTDQVFSTVVPAAHPLGLGFLDDGLVNWGSSDDEGATSTTSGPDSSGTGAPGAAAGPVLIGAPSADQAAVPGTTAGTGVPYVPGGNTVVDSEARPAPPVPGRSNPAPTSAPGPGSSRSAPTQPLISDSPTAAPTTAPTTDVGTTPPTTAPEPTTPPQEVPPPPADDAVPPPADGN